MLILNQIRRHWFFFFNEPYWKLRRKEEAMSRQFQFDADSSSMNEMRSEIELRTCMICVVKT